jgi:hypothetical protein
MRALVPWHHVGNGTRADMSSPPRRPASAGGASFQGAGFLDRLQADINRRQQNKVGLQEGSAGAACAQYSIALQ